MNWLAQADGLLSACFSSFGREVVYQGTPVSAIVDTAVEQEQDRIATYTRLFFRAADLPSQPTGGERIVIDGVPYVALSKVAYDQEGGVYVLARRVHP